MNTLLVALGGGLGAISRYLLGIMIEKGRKDPSLPAGVLAANIAGSGGLGLFIGYYYETLESDFYSCSIYLCLGLGFFGAFTTFSIFSTEALRFLQKKDFKNFLIYLFLTIAGSLAAFSAAFYISSSAWS